ncbi:hypothetical protein PENTCL1PPCAC_1943, partial [Pristionchus entomophagus]
IATGRCHVPLDALFSRRSVKALLAFPDEILLEIIERLSFTDRLQMRAVNHRLYDLESRTAATAAAYRSVSTGLEWKMMDGLASLTIETVTGSISIFTLPLETGLSVLKRTMKSCTFDTMKLLHVDEKCLSKFAFYLRHVRAKKLGFYTIEQGVSD